MLSYESIFSYRDVADPEGFEPSTCDLEGRRSIQAEPRIHRSMSLVFHKYLSFLLIVTPRSKKDKTRCFEKNPLNKLLRPQKRLIFILNLRLIRREFDKCKKK